ncbi:MAG: transcriptional regulator [Nitrospiraceae bacterium]|nr:transcriptional regulator [Nitrospiraceae bacterium]
MGGKVPCEVITWYVLPAIRRELSAVMISKYNMYQKDAAKLLGVTDAAVSQYLSRKRGNIDFDGMGKKEFESSAKNIIDGIPAEKEICRLCKFLVADGLLDKMESMGKS